MNSLDFALNTSIPSAQLDFDHTDLTFYATDWDAYRPENAKPLLYNERPLTVYPLKELSRAFHVAATASCHRPRSRWDASASIRKIRFGQSSTSHWNADYGPGHTSKRRTSPS